MQATLSSCLLQPHTTCAVPHTISIAQHAAHHSHTNNQQKQQQIADSVPDQQHQQKNTMALAHKQLSLAGSARFARPAVVARPALRSRVTVRAEAATAGAEKRQQHAWLKWRVVFLRRGGGHCRSLSFEDFAPRLGRYRLQGRSPRPGT